MGKSGKTKATKSASKAETKALKKAKAASKAERSQNKKAKDLAGESTSKASKKKGKGKAKQTEADDEEDLIQTLEEYRRRWEEGECCDDQILWSSRSSPSCITKKLTLVLVFDSTQTSTPVPNVLNHRA